MAKCDAGGKEMLTAKGCSFRYVKTFDGKYYERYKVGEDGWCEEGEHCGDCGAVYGYYHHPGCDNERCPICGGQIITCDCPITHFSTTKRS